VSLDTRVHSQTSVAPPPPSNPDQHVVEPNETITSIARDHGVTPQALIAANPQLRHADLIRPGEVLNVPPPSGIDPEVVSAVDSVLGPDATSEQRNEAYAKVQAEVDRIGGVGDAGIVAEAIAPVAAEVLQKNDIPAIAQPEVVKAVDHQIAPDATPEQRRAGYEAAQAYVDDVGGVGDAGIVEEYLPERVGQVLRDNGIPARYQQEVVDTVDDLLPADATPGQRERAMQLVQEYVDGVGGVGDAGIVEEYLPERAAEVLREHNVTLGDTPYGTDAYRALSSSDRALVRQAIARGDDSLPANLKSLIEDPEFAGLSAQEKTAVLSQVSNYPEAAVAANIERLLAKDWFKDQSFEDKQRSLKVISQMSADDGGNRTLLDNTLNRLLDPGSDYALKWEDKAPDSNGNVTFGWNPNDSHDVYLNSRLMSADNGPVDGSDEDRLGLDTLPHEISHAINDDETDQTFDYLNQEYRAWYIGFQAEHGRPPSNQEALERWEYFLNPNGGYAEYSHGIERDFWWDTDGALDKPEEAAKIYQMLSDLTGLEVNADNYKDVLASDPSTWKTDPNGDAATRWASGDDLDN
jgi:LysM repeat protein